MKNLATTVISGSRSFFPATAVSLIYHSGIYHNPAKIKAQFFMK